MPRNYEHWKLLNDMASTARTWQELEVHNWHNIAYGEVAYKGFGVHVDVGDLSQIVGALNGLPDKIRKRLIQGAMKKAVKPMVRAARSKAPAETRLLKKSIGEKVVAYRSGNVVVVFGPRTGLGTTFKRESAWTEHYIDAVKYAHLVEYGTRPHSLAKGDKLARIGPGAARAALRREHRVSRWKTELRGGAKGRRKYKLLARIIRAREIAANAKTQIQTKGARQHPGTKAQPFLRPAADQNRGEFVRIFANEVRVGLDREIAKR